MIELFVIDADGRNPVRLTDQIDMGFLPIRWSPDSMTIYYQLDVNVYEAGSIDKGTWYQTPVNPTVSSIDPYQNPVATQEEIEATMSISREPVSYYALSVCNYESPFGSWEGAEDECEKTLEIYDIETDELLWSFGRYRYDLQRFGILGIFRPFVAVLLLFSIALIGSGILLSVVQTLINIGNVIIKHTKPRRKQKEK